MPLKCSPFSLRFLFLFAQGEDSYSFSRACPSGSSCLSGHHPSPTSGWALSCLCSRTNPPLSPWRRALRPQDFGQYPGPGRRGESMWSQVPRGTLSQQRHTHPTRIAIPSFCGFTQHSSSIINTQLVSLCRLSIVGKAQLQTRRLKYL